MATPPDMLAASSENGTTEAVIPRPDRLAILPTDGELLMLFVNESDQAAFAELIERHGPMVWRVCRGILLKQQDAEDAYQATFLLLASKAKQVRSDDSAAGWLYRVAHRTALSAKRRSRRRREEQLETEPVGQAEEAFPDLVGRQMVAILLEELRSVPTKYQAPLVMRYLEGQSRRKIADQTGTTVAGVQGMLARGKQILRSRLIRRGVSLSVAMGLISATNKATFAAPSRLITQTVSSCQSLTTAGTLAAISATTTTLFQEGTRAMLFTSMSKPITAVAACSIALAIWFGSTAFGGSNIESPTDQTISQLVIDNSVMETTEAILPERPFVIENVPEAAASFFDWEEQSQQAIPELEPSTYTVQNKPELSINELNQRGWRSFYQGNNEDAESDFREILERDRKHLPALNGLAFALLNQGNLKEAKPLFEKYLKKEPKASGPLNGLARCLAAEGDIDGAIKLWEKGAKLTPGASAHTSALAFTYYERGEHAKAIPHFELLVKSAPGNARFLDGLEKAKAALVSEKENPTGGRLETARTAYPVIVSTTPAQGDKEVDASLSEVKVTFDRDMRGGMSWTGGQPLMPEIDNSRKAKWIDKRTCVLPVKLEKGTYYRIGINAKDYNNFKSTGGTPAAHDAIWFTTSDAKRSEDRKATRPKITKIAPANGDQSVDSETKTIRVTFDSPMSPGMSWTRIGNGQGDDQFPEAGNGKAKWSKDGRTCSLPVKLDKGQSYAVGLNASHAINFQSKWGIPIEPVVIRFTTED